MPGLAGMITQLPRRSCEDRLRTMVETMRHEDFYNHGCYSDPDLSAYVGWTSHRASFDDCMPVLNEKGDIRLFLAGEVFLDPALPATLRARGHRFSADDARCLIHFYEDAGEHFFSELNGLFSGILVDHRRGKCFVFNDRFGMHRLFVCSGKEGFFFASEAKALLSVLPETREFDPQGVVELVTCGCTLGERSLFRHVAVLPGGSLLEFENGSLARTTRYFDRTAWEDQTRLPETNFFPRVIAKLGETALRYASRGTVAMSLTGGFDCRMIMACLNPPPDGLPCYTFGSMYRPSYDVKVAQQVAAACKQPHHVLVLGEDFLQNLPAYLEKAVFLSDGYLGVSGAAELYANALGRFLAPVRLTGNWGSELLRGVRAFKFAAPKDGFLNPDLGGHVQAASDTFYAMSRMNPVSFAAFHQAPQQSFGRLAIERSQLTPRTPFLDNHLVRLLYQAPEGCDGFVLSRSIIGHFRPDLLKIETDRGYLGAGGRWRRFLRHGFREVVFKAEYYANNGFPVQLKLLAGILPQNFYENIFLGRNKFYHFRKWFRQGWASDYVIEKILSRRTRLLDLVSGKAIDQLIAGYRKDGELDIDEVDKLLTLSLASEKFT